MKGVSTPCVAALMGLAGLIVAACAQKTAFTVDTGSVPPGTKVTRQGKEVGLLGSPLAVGQPLPATALVDAATMQMVDLSGERGKVLLLSMIHSVDTGL